MQIQSLEQNKKNVGFMIPERDEVTVEDMQKLTKKVEEFYEARGNPRMNIVWLSNLILKRLKLDRDYYVNIEGIKGTGKSNFILLLSLIQCRYAGLWKNKKTGKIVKALPRIKPLPEEWEQISVDFDFNKNMVFLDESEDVKSKFNSLNQFHPLIIDEGSKNLHKYQWNNKLQFLLVRMSDTERWQNKSVYVCFPNFKELNPVFRNDRISMRIYLYDRDIKKGFASCILSLRDTNRYITDPWHNDENSKSYEYILRRVPIAFRGPRHILNAERKLKNYAGHFDIPSLEKIAPKIWNTYMNYKTYYANKDAAAVDLKEEQEESVKVKKLQINARRLIEYIKMNFKETTNKDLQKICGMTSAAFIKLMHDTEAETLKTGRY